MRRLILQTTQSPGDVVMLAAAVEVRPGLEWEADCAA